MSVKGCDWAYVMETVYVKAYDLVLKMAYDLVYATDLAYVTVYVTALSSAYVMELETEYDLAYYSDSVYDSVYD